MTLTVHINKVVYGGDGLGRLGDGRVVFVPGTIAGETVKAEIVESKRHFVRARVVEMLEPSPERREVPADAVPGMVYSHMSYRAEHEAKAAQLEDFLSRARFSFPSVLSLDDGADEAAALHYRNKAVYHFAKQGGSWAIGYQRENSHEVVDVTSDPLVVPQINAALPDVRKAVLALLTQGPFAVRRETERQGIVTARWTPKTGVKWWVGSAPKDLVLKETTLGRDYEVPAGGFYQVNPRAGERLVKAVVEAYHDGESVAPNVLDLYCGVGVFGLACRPKKLIGIESGREAVDFARRNAAAHGMEASFFAEEVAGNLKRISISSQSTVIIDPPRGGLERGVPEWLARSPAPIILCVSCDPATLVRDLRVLTQSYDIARVAWTDMFPRTARFETFVVLRHR